MTKYLLFLKFIHHRNKHHYKALYKVPDISSKFKTIENIHFLNLFLFIWLCIQIVFQIFFSLFKLLKPKDQYFGLSVLVFTIHNGIQRSNSITLQILTIHHIERVRAKNLEATLLFVDFSKAYSIHRGKIEQILLSKKLLPL